MSQRHFQMSPIRSESTRRGNVHIDVESVESERSLSEYSVFVLHICSCKLRNEKCVLWFCSLQVREEVRSTRSREETGSDALTRDGCVESANNPISRTNVSNSQNVSAKPQIRSGWTFLYVSTLFLSCHSAVVEKTAYSGLENIMVWIEIPVFVATST